MVNRYIDSKYRWYVLSLGALTLTFCLATPYICISVLFNEISADLGLNLVQVGWIWGFYPLSSFLTFFIAGLLADRFGARRILIIACTIGGLAGASRGLANGFISLTFATFLTGLFSAFIMAGVFKIAAIWFTSRQLGLATGILTTGIGVGFTVSSMISATLLSPLLGSWRRVLFLYGSVTLLFAFLWFFTVRDQQSPGGKVAIGRTTLREAICHVLRNKNVWLIGLAMLGYTGCIQGMCGYLPLYLREFKGWLPTSADGTLATFTAVSTIGAIPIAMFADRVGRRKLLIITIISTAVMGMGLMSIADGIIIWVIVVLVGVGRDGLIALAAASVIDSQGIGILYSGTALGLTHTIARLGPSISPPIGNGMASNGSEFPFIVWAMFGLIALVCFSLTKETGHRRD